MNKKKLCLRKKIAMSLALGMAIFSFVAPSIPVKAADTPINETTFPDDVFRQYVSDYADVNKDGYLSDSEKDVDEFLYGDEYSTALAINSIDDITGIEYFTNIETMGLENLTTNVDLNDIPDTVKYLYAYNASQFTSLDFSFAPNLVDLLLWECDNVESIDISACPNLNHLSCYSCDSLLGVDVTGNLMLETLYLDWTNNEAFTSIDLSNNTMLESISMSPCNYVTDIKMPATAPNLVSIGIYADVSDIDLSGCTGLEHLDIDGTRIELENLTIPNPEKLVKLTISEYGNESFSEYVNLESLYIYCDDEETITGKIDLTACTELYYVGINGGWNDNDQLDVSSIDISTCTKLESLDLHYCGMESLDLSNNTNLNRVYINEVPKLATVDFTNLTNLKIIKSYNNNLVSMYLPDNFNLEDSSYTFDADYNSRTWAGTDPVIDLKTLDPNFDYSKVKLVSVDAVTNTGTGFSKLLRNQFAYMYMFDDTHGLTVNIFAPNVPLYQEDVTTESTITESTTNETTEGNDETSTTGAPEADVESTTTENPLDDSPATGDEGMTSIIFYIGVLSLMGLTIFSSSILKKKI